MEVMPALPRGQVREQVSPVYHEGPQASYHLYCTPPAGLCPSLPCLRAPHPTSSPWTRTVLSGPPATPQLGIGFPLGR